MKKKYGQDGFSEEQPSQDRKRNRELRVIVKGDQRSGYSKALRRAGGMKNNFKGKRQPKTGTSRFGTKQKLLSEAAHPRKRPFSTKQIYRTE